MARARAVQRNVVESYTNYAEAEHAVDRLSDDGFPVERLTILAHWLSAGRRDSRGGSAATGNP